MVNPTTVSPLGRSGPRRVSVLFQNALRHMSHGPDPGRPASLATTVRAYPPIYRTAHTRAACVVLILATSAVDDRCMSPTAAANLTPTRDR
jgi:hypothetical protein